MHTVEIPEKKIMMKAPENVWECSRDQYIFLLDNYLDVISGKANMSDFRVSLVYYFFNLQLTVNMLRSRKNNEHQREALINITRLGELFDSFFKEKEVDGKKRLILDSYCPVDHVKSFKHNHTWYYTGGDALSGLTFGEYIAGISAFESITDFSDLESYVPLVAVLCAPEKHFTFMKSEFPKREPFSQETHQKRISKLKDVPRWVLLYARFAWESHLKYISDGPITINGKEIDLRILFGGESGGKSSGLGMNSVLFKLAETGVFGDYEKTMNQPLYTVFAMLYQQQWDIKEAKKKLKKK